jgi:hypothetical protein
MAAKALRVRLRTPYHAGGASAKSPSQLMSIKLGIVSARNEISEQVIAPLPIDSHPSFGGNAADAVRAD